MLSFRCFLLENWLAIPCGAFDPDAWHSLLLACPFTFLLSSVSCGSVGNTLTSKAWDCEFKLHFRVHKHLLLTEWRIAEGHLSDETCPQAQVEVNNSPVHFQGRAGELVLLGQKVTMQLASLEIKLHSQYHPLSPIGGGLVCTD